MVDGYNFGDNAILNPWSVMNFVVRKKKIFKPYWQNTASMDMIEETLTPGNQSLRDELYDLIKDRTIIKPIDENILFQDVTDRKSELIWSFLLHSGYLKTVQAVESAFIQKYQLKIPNNEVKIIYSALIDKWIKHRIDLRQLEHLLSALKQGDIQLFEQKLKSICLEIMSFHNFAGKPENVYHALVLGMLVWLADEYEIRSNRESGYGRYDIMLRPKDKNRQGIIIEFKLVDCDDNADKILNAALEQIDEKEYTSELTATGICDILKIAIGFTGKAVYLRSRSSNTGLASLFILLILSMLSLISLSLFRTSINNHYCVQNELLAKQSFYRAQSVAGKMANTLRAFDLNDLNVNRFSWLLDNKSIDLKSVDKPSFWKQLTTKKYPPDAQAIAVLLETQTSPHMPAESLIMTHDRHIQTCYFSILAMAEVSGSTSIVEMGFRKQFVK